MATANPVMLSLADLILIVHLLFVLFIVVGLCMVWIGAALGWNWIRNLRFRVIHLAGILFVAAEASVGATCPLTWLEDWLRGGPQIGEGFIQRWVSRILYYNLPPWVFAAAYLSFAAATALTFILIRPARKRDARDH